jgi:hypothetical protein
MNPSAFSQAVDEVFPKFDEQTRTEIKNRVFEHMISALKGKLYAQDPEGELRLLSSTDEEDPVKKAEQYLKQIFEKFASLSTEEQTRINKELDDELTRVMHEIYKAYD